MIVTLFDFPYFFAGVGVEGDGRRVELVHEDLAVRECESPIHRVAAGDWDDLRILLRNVLPFRRSAFFGQIERIDDVWKRRMDVHRAADHQGTALMSAQNAG